MRGPQSFSYRDSIASLQFLAVTPKVDPIVKTKFGRQ